MNHTNAVKSTGYTSKKPPNSFVTKLSCLSCVGLNDMMEPDVPDPSEHGHPSTLIILDWDDTCLATSLLSTLAKKEGRSSPLELDKASWWSETWDLLETSIIKAVSSFDKMGQIHIVTNAQQYWVEMSCSKFFPRLKMLLDQMEVNIVSARAQYEHDSGCPKQWKVLAMKSIMRDYLKKSPSPPSSDKFHQCFTMGDAPHDVAAFWEAATHHNTFGYIKSLKFNLQPSLRLLKGQWEMVEQSANYFCKARTNFNLSLQAVFETPCQKRARSSNTPTPTPVPVISS